MSLSDDYHGRRCCTRPCHQQNRQQQSQRRRRIQARQQSNSFIFSMFDKMMTIHTTTIILLILLLHNPSSSSNNNYYCYTNAKEIVATNEWQLLSDNDTIPAGLHVRMDLTTGEKWVKIATNDDEENEEKIKGVLYNEKEGTNDVKKMKKKKKSIIDKVKSIFKKKKDTKKESISTEKAIINNRVVETAVLDASGALSIVETDDDSSENSSESPVVEQQQSSSSSSSSSTSSDKDYQMMHRVMSHLPPEELEKFGGLPELPSSLDDAPSSSTSSRINQLPTTQRQQFEERMEEIWIIRQEELRKIGQENIADMPSILKERIVVLVRFLENVHDSLNELLQERQRQHQEEDEGEVMNNEKEGKEKTIVLANNIITVLQDLEYQLSDVDMARDFHTLGGWPCLVTLLDDTVHTQAGSDEGAINDDYGNNNESLMILVDEIQALAAMTIGTAVSNLGEFRVWALEDVRNRTSSTSADDNVDEGPQSALSLLMSSFENELLSRTQHMSDGSSTMAIPNNTSNDKYKSHALYKLRAIYALGSLLRGNPLAQQYFVSHHGPNILVRNVLGTLSTVRGPSVMKDKKLVGLDYKFASKVLALGQDVVMDVVLHEDDYSSNDNNDDSSNSTLSPNQLVGAFTTEEWCDLSLRMLSPPIESLGDTASRGTKERAMHAIRALAPGCMEQSSSQEEVHTSSWGVEEVKLVRSEWNQEGSDDGLDSVYRRELLDLADSVLKVLTDEQTQDPDQ